MELDISSLWTWTIPLWGMFLLVLFLTGILSAPVVLQGIAPSTAGLAPTVAAAPAAAPTAPAAARAPAAGGRRRSFE
ncbi:hypothetical protein EBU99_14825 [bacterium]|nr:hypothetical protein [bacterium]